jgi:hypothetical protein
LVDSQDRFSLGPTLSVKHIFGTLEVEVVYIPKFKLQKQQKVKTVKFLPQLSSEPLSIEEVIKPKPESEEKNLEDSDICANKLFGVSVDSRKAHHHNAILDIMDEVEKRKRANSDNCPHEALISKKSVIDKYRSKKRLPISNFQHEILEEEEVTPKLSGKIVVKEEHFADTKAKLN